MNKNPEDTFGKTLDDEEELFGFMAHKTRVLEPKMRLGEHKNYQLDRRLGRGGMGEVWLADELLNGACYRKVACKILAQGDREKHGPEQEFRNSTELHHENICSTHALVWDPEFGTFIVMDYVEGRSLDDWVHENVAAGQGLSVEQVLALLQPIACALDYAHDKKVVHRDVKPQNIMLKECKAGALVPVLLDFGIAAQIYGTMTVTMEQSARVGTPAYMSPEQCLARPEKPVEGASDQYSLAVVAYELLSGHLPFQVDFRSSGWMLSLYGQIVYEKPQEVPSLPVSVNFALQKALAKEPKERFESCMDFMKALAQSRHECLESCTKVVSALDDSSFSIPKENTLRMETQPAFVPEVSKTESFQEFIQQEGKIFERLFKEFHDLQKEWTGTSSPVTSKKAECQAQGEKIYKRSKAMVETIDLEIKRLLEIGMRTNAPKVVELQEKRDLAHKPMVRFSPENFGELLLTNEELMKPTTDKIPGQRIVQWVNGIDYAFRWCPAGTFTMGSSSGFLSFFGREEGRNDNETQHKVTLTQGFWMLETEVTQEQWQAIMGNNPSHFKGDNLPVEMVSWNDCQEFCEKFNAASGLKISLPTEAQWEYACRAGTTTAYNFGSSLNGDKANCDGNFPCGTTTKGKYLAKTTPVGSYPANAWGLYDMHGNVYEWCLDLYDSDYYAASPTSDPLNSKEGTIRVYRGGSWLSSARNCRSAYRLNSTPDNRGHNLGFRPLLVLSCPGFGS